MSVKIVTKKNDFPKIEATLSGLKGKKVNVGVLGGGEQSWLAGIHEYGCNIPVTDKMRQFLHSKGLHLKPTTTEIHIPERSFLRAGHDAHIEEILDKFDKALMPSIVNGQISPDAACQAIGILLSSKIKDFAKELNEPAKHPFTLEMNGGKSNPLVQTGAMIGAITYEVE